MVFKHKPRTRRKIDGFVSSLNGGIVPPFFIVS